MTHGENRVTYESKITEDKNTPPDDRPGWERVFSFAVGKVEGAGGSPARPS